MYDVKLDYPAIDPSSVITFRTSGRTTSIAVYTYYSVFSDSLYTTPISYYVDEAVIENVRAYTDNDLDLLAVVTNSRAVAPYDTKTPIQLTIEVSDQPVFKACYIAVDVNGLMRRTSDETTWYTEGSVRRFAGAEGAFSGRTFTGDLYENTGYSVREATIMLTVDPGFSNVESFSVSGKEEGGFLFEWSAEGGGVPLEYREPTEMRFASYGSSVCANVTSYTVYDSSYSSHSVLQSYDCDTDAELEIIFWLELP
jgi:hypothetical protein